MKPKISEHRSPVKLTLHPRIRARAEEFAAARNLSLSGLVEELLKDKITGSHGSDLYDEPPKPKGGGHGGGAIAATFLALATPLATLMDFEPTDAIEVVATLSPFT